MKAFFLGSAAAVFLLIASSTPAQTLRQPTSVRPVKFNYTRFAQEEEVTSPSDYGSAPAADPISAQPLAPAGIDQPIGSGADSYVVPTSSYSLSSSDCAASASCDRCGAASNSGCGCGSLGSCGLFNGGLLGGGLCNGGPFRGSLCHGGLFDGGLLNGGLCSGLGLALPECCLGDAWTLKSKLDPCDESCLNIGGWISSGYHSESNDLFNSHPDRLNLHQAWLYAEKVADGSCGLDWGFRADIMYGVDAQDTQAFGNPVGSFDYLNGWDHGIYGWAMPQLYGEVAYGDWSVKFGHFFKLVGYETVTAPDNFFYSHAMTFYNSEPFTHTGVLATRTVNDELTVYAGWTLGWDTGFDQLNQGSNYLGGFSYALSEDLTATYISTIGNFGWRGTSGYMSSLVLDMNLTDKLNYIFQNDILRVDGTGEDTVDINQYLIYTVNDCLAVGARMEWYKADFLTGYAPHGGVILPGSGNVSYYAATFGANYKPHANLTLRPEYRHDWSPAAGYEQGIFGIDAIFTF